MGDRSGRQPEAQNGKNSSSNKKRKTRRLYIEGRAEKQYRIMAKKSVFR